MSDIIEVENKIIILRGQQVILDADVAELYGVETIRVNEAVSNNPEKFPEGYVWEIDNHEFAILRSKFSTTKFAKTRQLPKAFTEKGLYMLATILKSPKAVETTIAIVEAYAKLKELSRVVVEVPQQEDKSTEQQVLLHRGGQLLCFGAHDTRAARRREDAARPHTALTSFACKGLLKYCVFDTLFRLCGLYFCPDDACVGHADGRTG